MKDLTEEELQKEKFKAFNKSIQEIIGTDKIRININRQIMPQAVLDGKLPKRNKNYIENLVWIIISAIIGSIIGAIVTLLVQHINGG